MSETKASQLDICHLLESADMGGFTTAIRQYVRVRKSLIK